MKWILQLILLAPLLSSCTDCLDCGVLVNEPNFPIQIFDIEGLNEASSLLSQSSEVQATLQSNLDSLESILSIQQDSLNSLGDSLALGLTQYQAAFESISAMAMATASAFSEDSTLLVDADSLVGLYTSTFHELNVGLTRIDTLHNLDENTFITYDSASTFNIPLTVDRTNTSYRFQLNSQSFTLEMSYELELVEDDKSRIGYLARNIAVISHSFDSLTLNCTQNCLSSDGNVVAYY